MLAYSIATFRWSRKLFKRGLFCDLSNNWLVICVINFLAISPARAEGLCNEKDNVIFNCESKKAISSLCQSKSTDVLSYRSGSADLTAPEISDNGARKGKIFYLSSTPYAGGGETHIRFFNSGYTYYLYDKTIKAEGGPAFSAGIVAYKRGRQISNLVCGNDASIRQSAFQKMARENYRRINSN